MSMRNVRKLFGTTTLPPLEGNSDEEFEPLYVKQKGKKTSFTYEGLEVSSKSDTDDNEITTADNIENEAPEKKKKKKKKRQRKPKSKPEPIIPEGVELDEIDRSVLEVNAILGGPPSPSTSRPVVEKKPDPVKKLLSVQSKHLNYQNEIIRIFGSETPDEDGKAKKYRPHNVVKYRRATIIPTPENYHYRKVGFSMSLLKKENGLSYFVYNHNGEYQKMHRYFLQTMNEEDSLLMNIHVEAMLKTADNMFRAEEFTAANTILEQIITYLQYAAHPYFNLTDQTIRLEYKYMENRPFFVAVLKYLYMLSNKACHRTALELAKLLLNLDPSDPLAIIYVIDVIALRAREHEWLIEIIDYWSKERDAYYLFNIKYSYALAHFHVAKKRKTNEYDYADGLLKEAILAFPSVTVKLLEACKHDRNSSIPKHSLFVNPLEDNKASEKCAPAITLFAKLVCWKWREPAVMEWFLRNVKELIHQYDTDPSVKIRLKDLAIQRQSLFPVCPIQIQRHMHVVHPMANLLVEWDMPSMGRSHAWDPLPASDGINRYGYGQVNESSDYYSALYNLIFSIRPDFIQQGGQEIRNAVAPNPPEGNPPAERVPEQPPVVIRAANDRDSSVHSSDFDTDEEAEAELEAMHREPPSSSRR
ncbi:unnamed protein product [Diatraea saccharalis]|uniref:Transcription factor 25 n=1 Tax=Diatraea saccharalis TaxID=40085 RepID=A0A9N9N2Y0_9NEOP|nr:unnamed protein product [Diatraea saccharalis]